MCSGVTTSYKHVLPNLATGLYSESKHEYGVDHLPLYSMLSMNRTVPTLSCQRGEILIDTKNNPTVQICSWKSHCTWIYIQAFVNTRLEQDLIRSFEEVGVLRSTDIDGQRWRGTRNGIDTLALLFASVKERTNGELGEKLRPNDVHIKSRSYRRVPPSTIHYLSGTS